MVQAGMKGIPARPPGVFDDLVWELLKDCWSQTPEECPPIAELYHTLKSSPKVTHTPWGRPAVGELPGTLGLHVHSIDFSESRQSGQFYVKFKYGNKEYATPPTNLNIGWGEHAWFASRLFQLTVSAKLHIGVVRNPG